MPKIAQYQGNQVLTEVVRQPRADASAGSAVFQSNIRAGQELAGLAQSGLEIKQRVDTTSAEEALVKFERDKNNLFFNPENGYFNTQGKNAYDNANITRGALEDLKNQYGESLSKEAKMMFDKAADAQIMRSNNDIMRHSSKGLKAWEVSTIQAQVENTIENASLYWNQPDKLRVQNVLGRQAVIDAANLEGIGAEATNERLQTYESSFAKSTIVSAIGNSASDGKEMMEKFGDKLEGPDKVAIQKQIDAKVKAEKIQSDSQQAIITGAQLVEKYDSREELIEQINQIKDPELRKKTEAETMRQFDLKRKAESEAQRDSFERAENHVMNGGSAETFQAEDPEGWEKLSVKQKKSIQSGQSIVTNWNTFSDLMTLPKEKLKKINPTDHFHELAPAERAKLVSAVKSANGTGSSSDKVDHQVGRTRNAQTTSAVEQILGKKSKWNDEDRKKADAFYELLDGEVNYREAEKGGKLSSEEFTKVLSELTRETTIKRSTFGIDFLAPDVEQRVTDIPPDDLRELTKFLRDNGVPVTADTLAKAQRQASE